MTTEKKKSKRKPGRPKLPPQDARSRTLLVRVTEEDYKRFVKAAKLKEQNLSDWVRDAMLGSI
jgi:predicted HicB family RNase H-like nuclease